MKEINWECTLKFSVYRSQHFRPMSVEPSDNTDDPKQIWQNKICDAESLLVEADVFFGDVEGIEKYKKKLKNEVKFLTTVSYPYQLIIFINE